jgi:hypothetical protein
VDDVMMPKWSLVLALALVLGVCLAPPVPSQPVRGRVFRGVEITRESGRLVIDAGFNFPVRYVRHFPRRSGEELQVYLQPVAVSRVDRTFTRIREAGQIHSRDTGPLESVTYEGGVLGGPLLTFLFDRPVQFEVRLGEDFRSFVVSIDSGIPPLLDPDASAGVPLAGSQP